MRKFFLCLLVLPMLVRAAHVEQMSIEEKVGQLFCLPFSPQLQSKLKHQFIQVCEEYHIGSVLVKQGTLKQIASFNQELQKTLTLPVLISSDSEWGLGMRVSDGIAYPKALTLGEIDDEKGSLTRQVGRVIGEQCKELGIHWNFAPVMDVNSDQGSPVIGMRAFSSDFNRALVLSKAYYEGLEKEGVLACGKHFPGHGAVKEDSHLQLAVLDKSFDQIEQEELIPFYSSCMQGIGSIMTGHILVPSVDPLMPASLSPKWVNRVLKEQWGYQGIIVTDALNMGALKNLVLESGEKIKAYQIPLLALKAGNHVLLYGTKHEIELQEILKMIPKAIALICKEAKKDTELLDHINKSAALIEKAKKECIDPDWQMPSEQTLSFMRK